MKGDAQVITGEKAKMISAWGSTATEAFSLLGPLVDKYIEKDWLLQGVNVYVEQDLVNLTATISHWKK